MNKSKRNSMFAIYVFMLLLGTFVCVGALLAGPAFVKQSGGTGYDITDWFGIFELPFLFLCVFFAIKTANALKGGVFGKGMGLMAWGFLVMGIGHLHLQIIRFFNFNLFNTIFGDTIGSLVWIIALIVTWTLSGLGFYTIYKVSSSQ